MVPQLHRWPRRSGFENRNWIPVPVILSLLLSLDITFQKCEILTKSGYFLSEIQFSCLKANETQNPQNRKNRKTEKPTSMPTFHGKKSKKSDKHKLYAYKPGSHLRNTKWDG